MNPGPAMAAPIDVLGAIGVIPVVVIDDESLARPLAEALTDGGIRCAEITLRTRAALPALAAMAACDGFLAGAGTVLEPAQAAEAARAGARFAVSPGFDPELLQACMAWALPLLPGAATTTEILRVHRAGIRICKFFPAEGCGGRTALNALAGPFHEMRFVPTGGIDAANAPGYLSLPCVHAVGGSWLVAPDLVAARRWDRIRQLSAQAVKIAAARPRSSR
jgi:2-dehydro-3-deoxyphosphogluconate aldolase / (4S)-4-hydroxy-2-oxoglutarate aldolase